ncbi:MAG: DUF3108 domain-containing protein [bacterium]
MSVGGKGTWREVHTIKKLQGDDGTPYYEIVKEFPDGYERTVVGAADFSPVSYHSLRRGRGEYAEVRIEYARGSARVAVPGRRIDKVLGIPDDTYEAGDYLMRGFPFGVKSEVRFNAVTPLPMVLPMYAEVLGEEEITVPAGRFPSYKVEMGMGGIIGLIAPKHHCWFYKGKPHILIRCVGPEWPGEPNAVKELAQINLQPPLE